MVVSLVVAATVGALGVGAIYLPFFADRDRIRGLHEESDLTQAEVEEYERAVQQMKMLQQRAGTANWEGGGETKSNNMWKRMDQAPKQQK